MINCFFGFYRLHDTLQGVWRNNYLASGMVGVGYSTSVSAVSVVATLEIVCLNRRIP